jgi:hypothetical protein
VDALIISASQSQCFELLNEILDGCDWCLELNEDCTHCHQKRLIANIACAWAFDLGLYG